MPTIPPTRTAPRLLGAAVALALSLPACRDPAPPAPPPPLAILEPPLHDARPGEELRLRCANEDWVWRVTGGDDDFVDVDFLRYVDGRAPDPGQVQQLRWPRNGFGVPPGYVIRDIRRDRIEFGGRSWDCWVLRAHSQSDVRHYWITSELPVAGFLQIAPDDRGQPSMGRAARAVPQGGSWGK